MANNGLIHIAEILKQLNDELKLDNDKWEREQNVTTTILRPGDDGTGTAPTRTTTGEKDEL